MRAHAVVLFVVLAMVSPATPLAGAQSAEAIWDQGQQLARRGDYAAAQAFFADVAERLGPPVAPRALLLPGPAALAGGDTDTPQTVLRQLLDDFPNTDQLASAYFTLEQVRRAAGDCDAAMRALDAFESVVGHVRIGPYTAPPRAQCAAELGAWAGAL